MLKFSIITVCYNAEATIERTIASVDSQDYNDVEHLIIDGASIDSTLEIVSNHLRGSRQVFSEKDRGIYDAMNKGVQKASGDYILMLNADDWLEDGILTLISKAISNYPNIGIFHADIYYHKPEGEIERISPVKVTRKNLLYRGMPIFHPTMFVNREVYKRISYDDSYQILSDYKFVLDAYNLGVSFHYINEVVTNFSAGGVSSTNVRLVIEEGYQIRKNSGLSYKELLLSTILRSSRSVLSYMRSSVQ